MLLEAVTALAMIWLSPEGVSGWLISTGLVLVGVVWLLTFLYN